MSEKHYGDKEITGKINGMGRTVFTGQAFDTDEVILARQGDVSTFPIAEYDAFSFSIMVSSFDDSVSNSGGCGHYVGSVSRGVGESVVLDGVTTLASYGTGGAVISVNTSTNVLVITCTGAIEGSSTSFKAVMDFIAYW